jgi:hypothetical protein
MYVYGEAALYFQVGGKFVLLVLRIEIPVISGCVWETLLPVDYKNSDMNAFRLLVFNYIKNHKTKQNFGNKMYGIFLRKIFNKSDRDMPRNARRFT